MGLEAIDVEIILENLPIDESRQILESYRMQQKMNTEDMKAGIIDALMKLKDQQVMDPQAQGGSRGLSNQELEAILSKIDITKFLQGGLEKRALAQGVNPQRQGLNQILKARE